MPGGCRGCLQTPTARLAPSHLVGGALPGLWLVLVVDFCLLELGKVGCVLLSLLVAHAHWPPSLPMSGRRGGGQKLLAWLLWCSWSVGFQVRSRDGRSPGTEVQASAVGKAADADSWPCTLCPERRLSEKVCFHAQLLLPAESLLCTADLGRAATCSFPSVQFHFRQKL